MLSKRICLVFAVLLIGTFAACGSESAESSVPRDIVSKDTVPWEDTAPWESAPPKGDANNSEEDSADEYRRLFGDSCIVGQIFEMRLDELDGKADFVPFAPSEENRDFHMQIVREGEVLSEITGFVPERLAGESFGSLDAVSFFDVNFDGKTDIVLIETYGDTSFAAVYYANEFLEGTFMPQEKLSERLTDQVEELTVPNILSFLWGGKRNGEFSDYREAYTAVSRLCVLETPDVMFDLIFFDDDSIPELAAVVNGYWVSLYTYDNGRFYELMDRWAYGAMGNVGYEYSPRKNSMRNYNNDFGGAFVCTTYMEIGSSHTMETVVYIDTYNFNDANKNGLPDGDELESLGRYSVSYIDGQEVTDEQCGSYDAGGYEYITGRMSREELLKNLGQPL